ncbi:MAG: MBL fold metallo-hydrolase [Ruminococcaceae bacterium]|nr:MBL fold metallo-hydrolase [Oscillospiraceae bacterium]
MKNNFEVYTLFSGSSGNSLFVKAGDTRILIDAGKSMRTVRSALTSIGEDLCGIDAVLITHAHSDHTRGISVISRNYSMPIYTTLHTARQLVAKGDIEYSRFSLHSEREDVEIGDLRIRSFVTPHDCDGSVGYIIDYPGDYRFGICTDTGCISKEMLSELSGCDGVVVEANYDERMLKEGPYPYYLKQRIAANTGHLSNTNAAKLCCMLADRGVKKIMLAHLSKENNLPELALKKCCTALFDAGFSDVDITVADRFLPTRF